jgi:hypothetical protein
VAEGTQKAGPIVRLVQMVVPFSFKKKSWPAGSWLVVTETERYVVLDERMTGLLAQIKAAGA